MLLWHSCVTGGACVINVIRVDHEMAVSVSP